MVCVECGSARRLTRGPVQTRNARRLQSTLVDSERAMVSTQIDPEDLPVSSGKFVPLSSDSDSPHVRRAPSDAVEHLSSQFHSFPGPTTPVVL